MAGQYLAGSRSRSKAGEQGQDGCEITRRHGKLTCDNSGDTIEKHSKRTCPGGLFSVHITVLLLGHDLGNPGSSVEKEREPLRSVRLLNVFSTGLILHLPRHESKDLDVAHAPNRSGEMKNRVVDVGYDVSSFAVAANDRAPSGSTEQKHYVQIGSDAYLFRTPNSSSRSSSSV